MDYELAIRVIKTYLEFALLNGDATGYDSGLADHIRYDLNEAFLVLTNLDKRITALEAKNGSNND